MYKKQLASLSFAILMAGFSVGAGNAAEGALGTVGEGIGTVGRGVGKGVKTVGRGTANVVRKVPVVGNIIPPENQGVVVGGAQMLPSRSIVENASKSNVHKTLVSAVKQAGLDQTLSSLNNGPYTVFAPTDQAFQKLPADRLQALLRPENRTELTTLLGYHVVPGAITSRYLRDGQTLTTINGDKLSVTFKNGSYYVNNARITTANAVSNNGVTHVIDSVLVPGQRGSNSAAMNIQ